MPPAGPARAKPPAEKQGPALEALLRDLGAQVRRGGSPSRPPAPCATKIPAVDELLGGGFPRGCLSEITGPPSSGRTSLALALLATATRRGELVAAVDVADSFDPESAAAAGTELSRILWVRAPGPREALRGTERLLQAHGFALVLLDLAEPKASGRSCTHPGTWTRLARASAATNTALVVLSKRRVAGAFTRLAVETRSVRARFTGTPALLEEFEIEVALVRHRAARRLREPALVRLRLAAQPPRLSSSSAPCASPAC